MIGKNRGIKWYVRFDDKLAQFMHESDDHMSHNYGVEPAPYSVRATINPKVLVGIRDYLTAASSEDLKRVETQFNIEAGKISPYLSMFKYYSMTRTDYCLNVDVDELNLGCSAKQLITLIRRGDIPNHFTEWAEYDEKTHRKETNKNAFYLQSKSLTINCYCKHAQLLVEFPECPDLENSRNLVRFEVQCKYPKVYSMAKNKRYDSDLYKSITDEYFYGVVPHGLRITNPIDILLSDRIADDIVRRYFNKIIREGDYLTLDCARWIIEKHNFRNDKKERLIWTLETINNHRGISKAKDRISNIDLKDFKRSLSDLDDILVNPVTIPRNWGIEHIPNPLRAYENAFEEWFIYSDEIQFNELLSEYLCS